MAVLRLHFKGYLLGIFALGWSGSAQAQMLVVSASLCADQYVIALVQPDQIKALSWQAAGHLSQAPTALRRRAGAWADGETLLQLAPANIVLDSSDKLSSTRLAQLRNSQVFQLSWSEDFVGIQKNLTKLGNFLQQTRQAQTIISEQKHRLKVLKDRPLNDSYRVLYLTPTLGTAGSGTYIDAAIIAAGGINLASEFGVSGWGQLPLEKLASTSPDLIVTSFFTEGPPSVLQFRVRHPVLRSLRKQVPQVEIPGGLWVCAGPKLLDAAETIAAALDKITEPPAP